MNAAIKMMAAISTTMLSPHKYNAGNPNAKPLKVFPVLPYGLQLKAHLASSRMEMKPKVVIDRYSNMRLSIA